MDRPTLATFLATANQVFTGKGDDFASYLALHGDYGAMKPGERTQAGQVLSMIDAMFGRYADASRHYEDSFPTHMPVCPAAPFHETSADVGIAKLVGSSRVLLINESHSKVQTRAAIIRLLPSLRKEGFTHIALEALNPAGAQAVIHPAGRVDAPLLSDDVKAGFYLREPVYAKMVESAQKLGFGLVAYEGDSTEHDLREAQQAAHLKQWLDEHPGARLIVVAGYSHIWKGEGWMAQKLADSSGQVLVSIDQIDGVAGCIGASAKPSPSVWISPDQRAWALRPDRVSATMTWKMGDGRGDATNWLSLGGARKRVVIPAACGGRRPCLVEARASGAPEAVPEDRVVAFHSSERPLLYLAAGGYDVVERTPSGAVTAHVAISDDGKAVWQDTPRP